MYQEISDTDWYSAYRLSNEMICDYRMFSEKPFPLYHLVLSYSQSRSANSECLWLAKNHYIEH